MLKNYPLISKLVVENKTRNNANRCVPFKCKILSGLTGTEDP